MAPARNAKSPTVMRKLIRWSNDIDAQLLLAINYQCNLIGLKLPWTDIAATLGSMGDNQDLFTEGSITQHLAKLYKNRDTDGLPVPPPIRRSRKRNNQYEMPDNKPKMLDLYHNTSDKARGNFESNMIESGPPQKKQKAVAYDYIQQQSGKDLREQSYRPPKYSAEENADGPADEIGTEDDSRYCGSGESGDSMYSEVSIEGLAAEKKFQIDPSKWITFKYKAAMDKLICGISSVHNETSLAAGNNQFDDPQFPPINVGSEVLKEQNPFIKAVNPISYGDQTNCFPSPGRDNAFVNDVVNFSNIVHDTDYTAFVNGIDPNQLPFAHEVGINPGVRKSQGFTCLFTRNDMPTCFDPADNTAASEWVRNMDPQLVSNFAPAGIDLTLTSKPAMKEFGTEGGMYDANEQHLSDVPEHSIFDDYLDGLELDDNPPLGMNSLNCGMDIGNFNFVESDLAQYPDPPSDWDFVKYFNL